MIQTIKVKQMKKIKQESQSKKIIFILFSLVRFFNFFSQQIFDTVYINEGIKYILKYTNQDGNTDTIRFEKRYKGKCIELVNNEGGFYKYYRKDPYLRVIRDKSTNLEITYREKKIEIKRKFYDTIINIAYEELLMTLYKKRKNLYYCKTNKNYKLVFKEMSPYDIFSKNNFDNSYLVFELKKNDKIFYQEGYVKIKFDKNKEIDYLYRIGRWLSLEKEDGEIKTYIIEYDNKKPENKIIFVEESVNEYITITTIQYVDIKPYKKKYMVEDLLKYRLFFENSSVIKRYLYRKVPKKYKNKIH